MDQATGISLGSVQCIWRAHKLQPHRLRTFKRSRDPRFAAKLADIVGLYVDPSAHAVVLSIDEKSNPDFAGFCRPSWVGNSLILRAPKFRFSAVS
jgi:hypothetical protein